MVLYVIVVICLMILLMNKFKSIVNPTHFLVHPIIKKNVIFYISIICDELLSWMLESWMKILLSKR